MRILVLGAYGFIGTEVVVALRASGHQVIGLGRRDGRRLGPLAHDASGRWVRCDLMTMDGVSAWLPLLDDVDVVVNASGVLQDGLGDDLSLVHVGAIEALIAACEQRPGMRFVQISAAGARVGAAVAFLSTKAAGDALVANSTLDWVILRPGLVIGRAAYGGSALLRAVASGPRIRLGKLGAAPIMTVSASELADVVRAACEDELPGGRSFDVLEERARSLDDTVALLRDWLGRPAARYAFPIPRWALAVSARLADGLGWLGWRVPFRSTAMRVLSEGVQGDPEPLRSARGCAMAPLEATLAAMPANVQERWFGRLYLGLPIAIGVLSGFWIASGVIGMVRFDAATALLAPVLGAGIVGPLIVGIGSVLDMVLGLAILFRRAARWASLAMVATTLGYLLGATWLMSGLWGDPLGPLVKTVPAMVLALGVAMLLDDR